MSYVEESKLGPIRRVIHNLWRPRTEFGRKVKHLLLTGSLETPLRRGRRFLGR